MQYWVDNGMVCSVWLLDQDMRAIAAPTLLECYIAALATYGAICLLLFVFSVQLDEQRHKIMAQDKARCIIFPSVPPDG
jgi:hypothetical protein